MKWDHLASPKGVGEHALVTTALVICTFVVRLQLVISCDVEAGIVSRCLGRACDFAGKALGPLGEALRKSCPTKEGRIFPDDRFKLQCRGITEAEDGMGGNSGN